MLPQSEENDRLNALGRSRGGYSTKLQVLTDANGTLVGVTATAGQTHEAAEFESLTANSCLSLYCRQNRPRALVGDKGYSSGAIRSWIESKSIRGVIPTRSNEATDPSFLKDTYRRRNIVERVIGWLKEARRIATRYEKLTSSYLAFVQFAATRRMIKLI